MGQSVALDQWRGVASLESLAHLWSIACEMQFYALALAVFLLGRGRPLVWGGLLAALVGAGALAPIRRVGSTASA